MKLSEFIESRLGQAVDKDLFVKLLKVEGLTITDIADRLNLPTELVDKIISELRLNHVMIEDNDGILSIKPTPNEGGKKRLYPFIEEGEWVRFGFISDNHLGSKFERLDALNALYDRFEEEDIKVVLNGGNWIEGEARFNRNEIHKFGLQRQIDYAVQQYPYRKGVETWFVSGDDHEGWYNQREGINIGDLFQMEREKAGMFDIKHLGYVEADIEIQGNYENPIWMRLMHPGGGSAYAISYAPQKIIESLQGGEKPNILFLGHFHKMSYDFIRGVHVVQMGCTVDQSIFMRKKRIEAHLGGGIAEFKRGVSGEITRFRVEIMPFYDKKFYSGKDKYWK